MRNDQTFRQELNQALDYADILDRIAGYASFSGSAARIREAMPVTDRIFVREQLDLAQEARTFTQNGQSASLAGITDIRSLLQMAQKGQVLTTQELLEVYLFLRAVASPGPLMPGCTRNCRSWRTPSWQTAAWRVPYKMQWAWTGH